MTRNLQRDRFLDVFITRQPGTFLLILSLVILPALLLTGCSLPFGDDAEQNGEIDAVAAGNAGPPGEVLDDLQPAPDFALTGHDDERLALSDLEGQVVAVFFGYTGCPDVCPMTLGFMAQATEAIGDDAEQVQFLLVTVDPERDDPEKLAQYVSRVDAPITGLTGNRAELELVWDDYDIIVERRDRDDDDAYFIDHSAEIWLINPNGELSMVLPMGSDGDDLAGALRWMLEQET